MLNMAVRNTNKLIREMSQKENVRLGRLFTKKAHARLLSTLACLPDKASLRILDAGAGTGILAAALLEAVCLGGKTESVTLVAYENDPLMLPMLSRNLKELRTRARRLYHVKTDVVIREESFLTSEDEGDYDLIITNPPTALAAADSPEVKAFSPLASGETELSALFLYRAGALLAEGGQLLASAETAFGAGVYVERLRAGLLDAAPLADLCLYPEGAALSLQKMLFLRLVKGGTPAEVSVSLVGEEGARLPLAALPYGTLVRGKAARILLVRGKEDLDVLHFVEGQRNTLASFGLKMRTGLTLPSRYAACISDTPTEDAVPLLHPRGIRDGRISFPLKDGQDYLRPVIPSLKQKNKNLLLIKRVPTKQDGRHIVAAAYAATQLPRAAYISTNNKLNYIDFEDGREMSMPFLLGLAAVMSSSLYERYITILNGKRQINASDYTVLPLPDERTLCAIGGQMAIVRGFSQKGVDAVVSAAFRKNGLKV